MAHLALAVHTVEAATAKVPFSMILLLDHAKRKTIPEGMRVRMVIPSDGLTSMSLWDCEDPALLKSWLDENLGADCISEVSEVQEEFTYGIAMELASARAAERMANSGLKTIGALGEKTSRAAEVLAAGVNTAVENTSHRLGEWDKRTGVITSAKATTAAAASRMAEVVAKAAENERVQNVMSNVQMGVATGWQKVSSWMGTGKLGQAGEGGEVYGAAGAAGGHPQPVFYPNAVNYASGDAHLERPLSSPGDDVCYDSPATYLGGAPTTAAAAAGTGVAAVPAGAHTLVSDSGDGLAGARGSTTGGTGSAAAVGGPAPASTAFTPSGQQ